ncbi:hypothetical protein AHMF7605_17325 [Adhaeribacter arboris]|uniref:Uncharacterized protein n=1 Tax=Adhaeribacter arboris TaxID=2072846 RepID=A0A2T2YI15_9BACT|nr:hypothetical protein [Adhaeribacter arboris]PSR55140.1 hypothetical protein AHMF7605_17325 [Adhaeribacter arboris]
MNDWPTYNQTKIADFVQELKVYFGNPLTIDSIYRKELDPKDGLDLWRHEAGSSVAEMIHISTRFEGESNFDKILQQLLNYYKVVKYHRKSTPKKY